MKLKGPMEGECEIKDPASRTSKNPILKRCRIKGNIFLGIRMDFS